MKLTQRMADVAYRWSLVNIKDLIEYKKNRETYEQIDMDTLENFIQFSTFYFCKIKYITLQNIEFVFGYRVKNKPDYFKKTLYQVIFKENEFNPEVIKKAIDDLVDNIHLCKLCDNGNMGIPDYDFLCRHCYIFGTVYEEDSCAICLTKDFGVWMRTPCGHTFHYKCYNQITDKLCPLCRTATGNNTRILDF